MHKKSITLQEIEDYLAGELSHELSVEFEKRLEEDLTAKHELMQVKKIIEGIQGFAFKQKLKEFHRKNFPPEELL